MPKTSNSYKECHILVWNLCVGHWILFAIWDLLFVFSSLSRIGIVTFNLP
jgi:hypothetical protein